MKRVLKKLLHSMSSRKRLSELETLFRSGLPINFRSALEYLITGEADALADQTASTAEARRAEIAAEGEKSITIWYSPKPGSAGDNADDTNRPLPGKTLEFTMKQIAETGKNRQWGIVLHLLAREFGSTSGIELGACAGISAIYLSSSPSLKRLVTVEGAEALSKIAEVSLKNRPNAHVVNALFDDAIDQELARPNDSFDLAYIDGHHEKVATIHYLDRLLPKLKGGALVIFDDISWSADMREAWNLLVNRDTFSHSLDLGVIGVCLLKSKSDGNAPTKTWDLQPITGRVPIREPHGWTVVPG